MTTVAARQSLKPDRPGLGPERIRALKYCCVSLLGFAVDAAILRLGLAFGAPAWVRVVSLICAMQVTFIVNGLLVFRTLTWKTLPRQWLSYMVTNGFGNFWNYWVFVTLVSLHWRIISDPMIALGFGAITAWMINFVCARFLVFGKVKDLADMLRGTGGRDVGPER
jgi:putative flippase GtrA